jgi:two-component system, sensor histidine kinase ChiS
MDGNKARRIDPAALAQRAAAALVLLALIAGAGAILVFVADRSPADAPRAHAGSIDLGTWDFARSGPINLSGEWAFASGEGAGGKAILGRVKVPGDWRRSSEGAKMMEGAYGLGEYALAIKRRAGQNGLALLLPDQSIAWSLYVNGELRASNGVPGPSAAATVIRREPVHLPLPDDETSTGISIRVSNFSYDVGGLINPILVGPSRALATRMEAMAILSGFFLGGLFVISLYHFFLFILRLDDKSSLYFSLFCFLFFFRSLVIEHYPERLFAGRAVSDLSTKIEYLCFYLAVPVYLAFLRCLFPAESERRVLVAASAIGLAFSAVVALTPSPFFMAWTTKPYQALTLAAALYALVVFARAASRRRTGALYGLVGFAAFFLILVNDVLHANLVIRTAHLSPLGLMIFMLADSLIVSSRISVTFEREKSLSRELAEEKRLLDARIAERTAELRASNDRLRGVDRAKSRFLATISHELRTPIALIVSPVEQAMRGAYGDSIPRDGELLSRLLRSGYRMLNIIEGMFDFARLELGRLSPRFETVDLGRTVGFYASELESLARKRGLSLSFEDRLEGLRGASIDPRLFEIAFFNLVSNALKFTAAGGSVGIVASGPGADGRASIAIRDTGIGIGPELLPRIFDKLDWQADSPESLYDGAGIGLSLSKKIVELHGGEILAESEPGRGSTFTILLPSGPITGAGEASVPPPGIGERARSILGEAREGESVASPGPAGDAGPSILLVEDNRELLEFLRERLATRFRVSAAADGEEALLALKGGLRADLVVTDVMMPRMDGSALLREARAAFGEACPPFIFLTARSDGDERREALAGGAVDYLAKPFDVDELALKIESLLAMRERASEDAKRGVKEALARFLEGEEQPRGEPPEASRLPAPSAAQVLGLTSREADIAERAAKGMQDKEIARELGLAARTVSNTLARIYRKAGVANRLELIRLLEGREPR